MITSQEKIAAALAYLFFWMPVLMRTKTEFTIFHMKQGFIFHCIVIVAYVIGHIWLVGGLIQTILMMGWIVFAGWSAYQAYLGSRFIPPYFGEYTNTIITKLGLTSLFNK